MMTVEEVRSVREIESLRDVWEEARRRSGLDSFFNRWSWVYAWCEVYAADHEPWVLLVRDERAATAAIAPLCIHRTSTLGVPVRLLKLLTWKDACSEMLDLIVADPSRMDEIRAALLDHLERRAEGWDVIEFRDLREGSVLGEVVRIVGVGGGFAVSERARTTNPYLRLPATKEAYIASLSRKTRESIRYYAAKLAREHRISYRTVTRPEELKSAFPTFVRLHESLWASRGRPGVFRREKFVRFHRRVAERLAEEGLLRMHFLDVEDAPVAAMYGFRDDRTFYYYQSGFDPAWSAYSVGKILLHHTILDSIETGLQAYDFLRGTTPFKAKFADESRHTYEVLAGRKTRAARVYLAVRGWRDRLGGAARALLPAPWIDRWRRFRDQLLLRG